MTQDRLLGIIKGNAKHPMCSVTIWDAVQQYNKSQNSGKPIVICCKELLAQMLNKETDVANMHLYENDLIKQDERIKGLRIVMQMLDEIQAL